MNFPGPTFSKLLRKLLGRFTKIIGKCLAKPSYDVESFLDYLEATVDKI